MLNRDSSLLAFLAAELLSRGLSCAQRKGRGGREDGLVEVELPRRLHVRGFGGGGGEASGSCRRRRSRSLLRLGQLPSFSVSLAYILRLLPRASPG